MSTEIGSVPLYLDEASGSVYVDPADAQGDEAGAFWSPRATRQANRLARIDKRIARLEGRKARLGGGEVVSEPVYQEAPMQAPADIYQRAAASGMISENQYNGLGFASVAAADAGPPVSPGTNFISDTINRHLWGKSLVLNSDAPAMMLVDSITVAGLPVNVGQQGAPLTMFSHDSTRFGISFGRRLALTGQTFRVDFQNVDTGNAHTVSGGIIADELNPYAMNRWMEQTLLQAAVQGFQG